MVGLSSEEAAMTNGTRMPVALLMLASGLLAGCEASSPSTPSLPPPQGASSLRPIAPTAPRSW